MLPIVGSDRRLAVSSRYRGVLIAVISVNYWQLAMRSAKFLTFAIFSGRYAVMVGAYAAVDAHGLSWGGSSS
jgi:hypothetical protein